MSNEQMQSLTEAIRQCFSSDFRESLTEAIHSCFGSNQYAGNDSPDNLVEAGHGITIALNRIAEAIDRYTDMVREQDK